MTRIIYHTIAMALIAIALTGCHKDKNWHEMEGVAWNTTYHIVYLSKHDLNDSVRTIMQTVEQSLSPFNSGSTISAINTNADLSTDAAIEIVFNEAKRISRLSDGLYDPTVATLVNLWGFGYTSRDTVPSEQKLAEAMATVGIHDCYIENGAMVKKHPDTEFNFSSIAKGYGCDEIGRMLQRNGCDDYMIEVGGEIAMHGSNPHGRDWRIMIDTPVDNDTTISHAPMSIITISDCGVATSGNYRNFRLTSIGKTSHTIDPRTGHPVTIDRPDSMIVSATVIAPHAITADAMATACMLMSPDEAIRFVDAEPSASAILAISISGDSILHLVHTSNFPPFEAK